MHGCSIVDKNNSDIIVVWLLSTDLIYKNGLLLFKNYQKQYLAHSDLKTTQKYLHIVDKNMQNAIDILDSF